MNDELTLGLFRLFVPSHTDLRLRCEGIIKPRGGDRIQTGMQPPIRDCDKNHPLPAPLAQGRGKGEGVAVGRGLRFAHPRLYSVAPSGLKAQEFKDTKDAHCQL